MPVATGTSTGTQKGSKGQFSDHESIMVDTSTAARHHFGRIYVTWAKFNGSGRSPIQVAFSDDNGQHWTGPAAVSDNSHQFDQDARVNIGPDGTVYDTRINSPNEKSLKNNQAMGLRSRPTARSPGVPAPRSRPFSARPRDCCPTPTTESSPTSPGRCLH